MKERPILFNGPMVRAILEGRKTQTRRPIKPQADVIVGDMLGQPKWYLDGDPSRVIRCPFGVPGERLWVRETFAQEGIIQPGDSASYAADWPDAATKWTPSIHMRREFSRIDLEVTKARVQRLQDITEEDAKAEGVQPFLARFSSIGRDQCLTSGERVADAEHRASFAVLWDELGGATWVANPWVWVIDFKVVRP
jgi:hypothetical protein